MLSIEAMMFVSAARVWAWLRVLLLLVLQLLLLLLLQSMMLLLCWRHFVADRHHYSNAPKAVTSLKHIRCKEKRRKGI